MSAWMWGLGIVIFAFGLAGGIAVAFFLFSDQQQSKKLRKELDQVKREYNGYREEVTQHFVQTSELFSTMTSSYRAVYEHLASGAHALCGDRYTPDKLDIPDKQLLEEGVAEGTSQAREPPGEESGTTEHQGSKGEP